MTELQESGEQLQPTAQQKSNNRHKYQRSREGGLEKLMCLLVLQREIHSMSR
jgi:hypothetical protein